jgi:CRP-like cAMP-binding protein
MADIRKLKDKAAELASKGKVEKAAEIFREILRADPRDVASCQKLADVLRRGGEIAEAVERYAEVAERFARDGLLIKAIAICKTILELDPEHGHTQRLIADLYGKRNIADAGRPPMRTMMAMPALKVVEPTPDQSIELSVETGIEMEIERGVELPLGAAQVPSPHPFPATAPPDAPSGLDAMELPPELQVDPDPFEVTSNAELAPPPTPPPPPRAAPPPPPRAAPTIQAAPPRPPPAPPPAPSAPPHAAHPTAFDLIVAAAEEAVLVGVEDDVAVDVDLVDDEALLLLEVEPEPEAAPAPAAPASDARLPRFPIFSDLSPEAFVALTQRLTVVRLGPGETVITEGDEGSAFFVIATGRLTVRKRDERGEQVVLAHLGEGEFFGEMALLSNSPRNATVVAEEPSEVLVLHVEVLRSLAGRYPHVADSLRRFYRQRLLANAFAVSPIFRPFGRGDRKAVMEKFRERVVKAGEVIVREGTPSDGLYVVLEGALDVTHRKEGTEVLIGHLREGDLFGEMSCLRKTGASSTVTVKRGGSLLKLLRADFDALVMTYPTVLELMSELSEERAQNLEAILSGSAEFTEDGLVLI